jgi:hypothetical protein
LQPLSKSTPFLDCRRHAVKKNEAHAHALRALFPVYRQEPLPKLNLPFWRFPLPPPFPLSERVGEAGTHWLSEASTVGGRR